MQFLIHVSGDVLDKQSKVYVVNSDSVESAQTIATQNFCDEFLTDKAVVTIKPQRRTTKAMCSFIFMLIPILLSFISWKNGHDSISISPDYISCLYGVLLYAAFVVRIKGIPRTVSSWIDIMFSVCSVLLLSTFIKTILVTETISLLGLGEVSVSTNVILPVAIILSWLGLKIVSLACMATILVIALFNITVLNVAMGMICGPLYIICAFVGIMLYLSIEPAFIETLSQFRRTALKSLDYIGRDISHAKDKITSIRNVISNREDLEDNQ